MKNDHKVKSIMLGAAVSAVFVVLVTVVGELYKPLKNWFAEYHYHHWVGKGIWAGIVFVVFSIISYLATKNKEYSDSSKAVSILSYVLVLGTIILFLFFTYEYFAHH